MTPEQRRDWSWTGDAVLSLCAREWILAHESETGGTRHDLFRDLTSNQFLASFGVPTDVEAHLGRLYAEGGLEAARRHFLEAMVPLFLRQQRKRTPARR